MIHYFLRRLALLPLTLLVLSLATFVLLRLVPGDPAQVMLGEHATAAQVAQFRASHGLDQPLPIQYARYLADLARGEWGRAIVTGRPVLAEIGQRLPATVELAAAAMLIACAVGIPVGALAGRRRHSWADRLTSAISLVGVALPLFWIGLLLSYIFGYALGWLPPSGRLAVGSDLAWRTGLHLVDAIMTGNPAAFSDALRRLALPALVLSSVPLAVITRMTRATLLETLAQDHVRTARAKGLPERAVLLRHGLRNAAPAVATVIGLQWGSLLSGAILVETVFAWPGVGQIVAERVLGRDYPAVQGIVLVTAGMIMVVNLATDLVCAALDPRIHYA